MGNRPGPPRRPWLVAVLAVATVVGHAVPAQAAESDGLKLEEVMVTARRRQESLLDTPLAVSAYGPRDLQRLGVTSIRQLQGITPGLDLGGRGSDRGISPYIRGNGQRQIDVTLDPSVAIYVNGVVQGRNIGTILDVLDLASVQILRGPQGTLFGKNVTGGAILLTTKLPTDQVGGTVAATAGDYGQHNLRAVANVPLVDGTLMARVAFARIRNDGTSRNLVDNRRWRNDDRDVGITQLRWLPDDDVSVDLFASYGRARQQQKGMQCLYVNDRLGFADPPAVAILRSAAGIDLKSVCNSEGPASGLDPTEFYSEQGSAVNYRVPGSHAINIGNPTGGYYDTDSTLGIVTVNWDVGPVGPLDSFSIKSITGYLQTRARLSGDYDGTRLNLVGRFDPHFSPTNQYSEELDFQGTAFDGSARFTAGLYAYREATDHARTVNYSVGPFQIDPQTLMVSTNMIELTTRNGSWAAFGQLSYDITREIEFTTGARYTYEKRFTRNVEYRVNSASMNALGLPADGIIQNFFFHFPALQALPPSAWTFHINESLEDSLKSTRWTPMVSFKFKGTPQALQKFGLDSAILYATWSTGFRSGGVQPTHAATLPNHFKPELSANYEIGTKLEAFDRKLHTEIAVFYSDYQDIQLTNIGFTGAAPVSYIDNAGRAVVSGFESEVTVIPDPNLLFSATVTYTHDDIRKYLVSGYLNGQPQLIDRSDEKLPNVPNWRISATATYYLRSGSWGTFIPGVTVRYATKIYRHFDRASWLSHQWVSPAAYFVDAQIVWRAPGDRLTVTLWGKNLDGANNDYLVGGVPFVEDFGMGSVAYAPPRTVGLDIDWRFGAASG